jgi:hypothetical protein
MMADLDSRNMLYCIIKDYCAGSIKLCVFPQVLQVLIHKYKVYQSDHICSNQLLTKTAKCMDSAAFSRYCRYLCFARDAVFLV